MNQRTEKRIKSENLDLEFKKILCIIREHIPYINSNAYLMQCRVWLEKLSSPNVNKILRNLYLVELCGQIQKNKLLPPFNEAPPNGSLRSITKVLMNRKSSRFLFQDFQRKKSRVLYPQAASTAYIGEKNEDNRASIEKTLSCPHNTETWELSNSNKELDDSSDTIQHEQHNPARIERRNISAAILTYQRPLQNNTLNCGEPITHVTHENDAEPCLTINELTQTEKDEDSWSDLTEGSSNAELTCQRENNLKAKMMDSDKAILINYMGKAQIGRGFFKTEQVNDSECEIPIFKSYDGEESNFKIPKDTNYISEDWKNTIDALQLRLSEMTQQNNELKSVIQKLEIEMDEVKNKHTKLNKLIELNKKKHFKEETGQTIKMIENRQFKEITKLKETHADKILQLEKLFQNNVVKLENSYEEKTNKIIASYEQKISEINKQNEVITRIRDNEISRLTELSQQQCTRITNDISALQNQVSGCSCDKKLLLIKKCVSKMDKLFQRSEKEYLRQIDGLRQELEVKNTALQIQLKMQKAELIAETSSERQEEFDKILNTLEVKYIKMLEMHENQIMEMKKQDDEKIQTLKELLTKHGILYDEDNI